MTETQRPFRPAQGVRVLELGNFLAGPLVGMLLADLGADVVKVEPPSGDRMRRSGMRSPQAPDGESPAFQSYNRGKRSLVADLSNPSDRQLVRRLADEADVFVENMRPGSLAKSGLDFASLSSSNSRLIYLSLSAFGQTGPYAHIAGVDSIIQAISGALFLTGEAEGKPVRTALPTADYIAGTVAAYGVLAALLERQVTGIGRWLQTSLLDAQMMTLSPRDQEYFVGREPGRRMGSGHPGLVPFDTYATADGALMLCVLADAEWRRLAEVVGLEAVPDGWRTAAGRVAARRDVDAALEAKFILHPTEHWLTVLQEADILVAPVNDLRAAFEDSQVRHNRTVSMIDHPELGQVPQIRNPLSIAGQPLEYTRRAPLLGEHSEDIRNVGWLPGEKRRGSI